VDPNVTTGIHNTFLYGEYGFTDRITGIFNGSIFSRNTMNNLVSRTTGETIVKGEALNAIGDIDLGVKYQLSKPGAKYPVAISATFGLPIGATEKGGLKNLQTGDGEFNQMIQVDFGRGFQVKNIPMYVSAYTGVNHRTNGFSEEFRYGLEVGIGLWEKNVWLNSKLISVESFNNGETVETVSSTSIFANNTEFTSLGFEANLMITPKVDVSANFATAFSGRIIAAAPSYSVGVFVNVD